MACRWRKGVAAGPPPPASLCAPMHREAPYVARIARCVYTRRASGGRPEIHARNHTVLKYFAFSLLCVEKGLCSRGVFQA